jgi:hypothetical protein
VPFATSIVCCVGSALALLPAGFTPEAFTATYIPTVTHIAARLSGTEPSQWEDKAAYKSSSSSGTVRPVRPAASPAPIVEPVASLLHVPAVDETEVAANTTVPDTGGLPAHYCVATFCASCVWLCRCLRQMRQLSMKQRWRQTPQCLIQVCGHRNAASLFISLTTAGYVLPFWLELCASALILTSNGGGLLPAAIHAVSYDAVGF